MAQTLLSDTDVPRGIEVLDRAECLRLLAGSDVGRVAATAGALPVVLPVRFRLVGEEIVFRAGRGSMLEAGIAGNVVAFEADFFDPVWGGWSVVATGVARRLGTQELPDVDHLPGWRPAGDDRAMAVSTQMLTGRRVSAY